MRLLITQLSVMLLMSVGRLTARAQVSQRDSLALVALYNVTDGPNWRNNTNWLSTPVWLWRGVSVTDGRVRTLKLRSNQLTGSIPPELSQLARLTVLNLNRNQLTGSIPPELGQLARLTILDLSSNQLTGSIPPELSQLARLTALHLRENQLTGSIPVELSQLTKLLGLILNANQLTGSIPPELGNLANLTGLHLNANQLTGSIPPELSQLTNLRVLLLGDNPLSGTLPLSLINLSNLNSFVFDNTNLCEPIDEVFQAWLQGINELRSTGCTNVATEDANEIPRDFVLGKNYPNPFGPGWSRSQTRAAYAGTVIRYALPQRASVRLAVYDVQGRRVAVLVEAEQTTGWHEVTFEAGALPSGVYLYRLEAGIFRATQAMLLIR